jgi:DNA (cytosine-5)-methyltransferase 1
MTSAPAPAAVFTSEFETADGLLRRRHRFGADEYLSEVAASGVAGDPLGAWWRAHLRGDVPRSLRSERPTVRTVDLFSGPGGLALGFRRACDELGLDHVSAAAADQDAEALQVYAANHAPRRWTTDSVSTLVDHQVEGKGENAAFVYEPEILRDDWLDLVGRTDVVLAGPPCQGHSNLNNRTRRYDKRNELYLTVPAIAVALQAPVVIIENVPAVVHDRQQVVASTVTLLKSAGYHVETGILHADRLGWAQTRQRYFVVARRDLPPVDIAQIAAALRSPAHDVLWAIQDLADAPYDDSVHISTDMSVENQRRIDYLFDNDLYDLPPAERPDCHKDGTTYNAVYGRLYPGKPAPTITTGFMTPGRGRYIHPHRRRVLTPREAARIQGFPDTYQFQVDPANPPFKLKLGKWIGDAVPMPLGHAAALSALLPGWG